jgi:hypothetical protein
MNRIPASASRRHSARTTRPLSASRTNSIANGNAAIMTRRRALGQHFLREPPSPGRSSTW